MSIKENGILLEFLMQVYDPVHNVCNFNVGWIKQAEIEKTDEKTIRIFDGSNIIMLEIKKQNKVLMTREDGRTYEFTMYDDHVFWEPEYPYLDGRRKLVRTSRARTEEAREPVKFDLIEALIREDELYQAIYRIRPLSSAKEIFVWGIVPEVIKNELTYKEINKVENILSRFLHELLEVYDPSKYFEVGRPVRDINTDNVKELDVAVSTADELIQKFLGENLEWVIDKKTIPESKKPINIVVKRA